MFTAGLERNPGVGQHIGLVRVVGLAGVSHAEHAAGQQRFQMIAAEECTVRQSQLAHDIHHGTRHVAEHHDFPRRFVEVPQCVSLVSDQLRRFGDDLVSDQVPLPESGLIASLIGPAQPFPQMFGDSEHRRSGPFQRRNETVDRQALQNRLYTGAGKGLIYQSAQQRNLAGMFRAIRNGEILGPRHCVRHSASSEFCCGNSEVRGSHPSPA